MGKSRNEEAAREKAFNDAKATAQRKLDSDAFRQRKASLSRDERATETIDRLTGKHMDFYERNGIRKTEESVRKEIAERASKLRRREGGE